MIGLRWATQFLSEVFEWEQGAGSREQDSFILLYFYLISLASLHDTKKKDINMYKNKEY